MAYKRRRVGKMSTETMVVLGVAAIAGLYFFTRTSAVPLAGGGTYVTGPQGQYLIPGNQTAQDITAGASGLALLIQSLGQNTNLLGRVKYQ